MKIVFVLIAMVFISMLSGCSCSNIDAGEEGVLTMKPIIFGRGGVDPTPISTGMTFTAWTTSVDRYDIKPAQYTEEFDDLITADNNPVDFNAYVELQIIKSQSPKLHEAFGREWYARKIKEEFRTAIRANGKKHTMFVLTSDPGVLDEMGIAVKLFLTEYVKKQEIPVQVNRVTIGKVSPPKEVTEETMRTAAQRQRKLTETERADAELSRKKAEENKALADRAYRENFGMSVDQYLELRSLEIEKEKLDIVRNKENVTIILNSGGAVPTFNTGNVKNK